MKTRDKVLGALSDGQEWTAREMSLRLNHDRTTCYDMLETLVGAKLVHVVRIGPTGRSHAMTKFYRIGAEPIALSDIMVAKGQRLDPMDWTCSILLNSSRAQ